MTSRPFCPACDLGVNACTCALGPLPSEEMFHLFVTTILRIHREHPGINWETREERS